jgi:hypothetical protein
LLSSSLGENCVVQTFVLCGSGRTAVVQIGDGEGYDERGNLWARRPNVIGRPSVHCPFARLCHHARWQSSAADDLVCDTIEQTFTEVNRLPTGVDLKVQMFAVLHGLHFGALRSSTEESAQQRESPSSKEEGLESDQLLRIFGRLRDERREALILTIASGLS